MPPSARRCAAGALLLHAIVTLLLLAVAVPALASGEIRGKVVKIRDGDSIDVRSGGETVRVRVYGIDCPERGQPWGARAKAFTSDLVGNREVVVSVKDVDRYGRKVAAVVVDGKDLGRELVRAGLAWHYVRYAHDAELAKLEADARAARRGLWSEPHPVAPWQYRHDRRAA